jgi:hypothetical protein
MKHLGWNRTDVTESKPPTRVRLEHIDGRSLEERISDFQARVFCTDYRMPVSGGRAQRQP